MLAFARRRCTIPLMKSPNILHIDDDRGFRSFVRFLLSLDFEDSRIDGAGSITEANKKLWDAKIGLKTYNLILLDGNLEKEQTDGRDAKAILQRIQELELPVVVIGMSAQPMLDYGIELEHDLPKEQAPLLPRMIEDLSRPTRPFQLLPTM